MKKNIAIVLTFLLFYSCNTQKYVVESKGKPYELFVVSDKTLWEGQLGDTIKNIFGQPVEMLFPDEPRFDVFGVTPEGLNRTIETHRNLIMVNVGENYPQSGITAQYDVHAQPQLVVSMQGPSADSLALYAGKHRSELIQIFEMAERNRFVDRAEKYNDKEISRRVEELFGFTMSIPRGYKIRNVIEPDFIWISNELPVISQGIVIYTYPYDGNSEIVLDSLIARRNTFVERIPGPSEGSYMTTSTHVLYPQYRRVRIADRYWGEVRGYWEVVNDYMGGPFVSYTTLNWEKNTVVTIDFYVYSPKYNKRNYIRQLESLVFGVKFPEDKTGYSTRITADAALEL